MADAPTNHVAKPFAFRELVARVRAISLRGPIQRDVVLRAGDLRLDATRHAVYRGNTPIDLSHKEFAMLETFMQEPVRGVGYRLCDDE